MLEAKRSFDYTISFYDDVTGLGTLLCVALNSFVVCAMAQYAKKALTSYTTHNTAELLRGGKKYFQCLKDLIDAAKFSIHLQVYIFDDDITGKYIGDALMDAAKRGVNVYVMTDGFASQVMATAYIEALKEAGIHFRMFEPVFKSNDFYFGRRMHYKVIVIDARYCLVGGINIADRYNDLPGDPAWLDFALLAQGEVALNLFHICAKMWARSSAETKRISQSLVPPPLSENNGCMIRVRKNDWVQRQSQVSASYLEMFRSAQQQIIVMSSYFLPGRTFRKSLSAAVRRGVKVKLVLAGESDIMIAKHAERYIYRWIFRNKMELYELSHAVLHAKIATCDNRFVIVGSYNINNISAYASVEMNLDVMNNSFATAATQELEQIIANECKLLTAREFALKFNLFQKIWQYTCYQVIRLIIFLFTFYFKQKER